MVAYELQGGHLVMGRWHILSDRTGFSRKICTPGHIILVDRFSSGTGYYTCLSCDLLLMPLGVDTNTQTQAHTDTHTPMLGDKTISRSQVHAGCMPMHVWFKNN